MPRTGKGGSRSGAPGKSYTNRTDLNTNKALPTTTVPNQPYGVAQQQQAAQAAIPMAGGPPIAAATSAPSSQPAPPPSIMPGDLTSLGAPSARPGEPVTAGMPTGPGPGPEALQQPDFDAQDLAALRNYLPALESLANLPNASVQTRNFVRRIRGAMPIEQQGAQ